MKLKKRETKHVTRNSQSTLGSRFRSFLSHIAGDFHKAPPEPIQPRKTKTKLGSIDDIGAEQTEDKKAIEIPIAKFGHLQMVKSLTDFQNSLKKEHTADSVDSNQTSKTSIKSKKSSLIFSNKKLDKNKTLNLRVSFGIQKMIYIEIDATTTAGELVMELASYLNIESDSFALSIYKSDKEKILNRVIIPSDMKIYKYIPNSSFEVQKEIPDYLPYGLKPEEFDLEIVMLDTYNISNKTKAAKFSKQMQELVASTIYGRFMNPVNKITLDLTILSEISGLLLAMFVGAYDVITHAGQAISYMHFIPEIVNYEDFWTLIKTCHSNFSSFTEEKNFNYLFNLNVTNESLFLKPYFSSKKMVYNKMERNEIQYSLMALNTDRIDLYSMPAMYRQELQKDQRVYYKDITKIDINKTDLIIRTIRDEWKMTFNQQNLSGYICPILFRQLVMQSTNPSDFERLNTMMSKKSIKYRFVVKSNGILEILTAKLKYPLFENYMPRNTNALLRPKYTLPKNQVDNSRESQLFWRDSNTNF